MNIKKEWKNYWLNPWMGGAVILAILGAIALIQTQQYVAEKTGEAIWWIGGGLLVAGSIFCFKKVNDSSSGKGG